MESGRCTLVCTGHSGAVTTVAVRASRSGREHRDHVGASASSLPAALLVSGAHDGAVILWDAESGAVLRVLSHHTRPIVGVRFVNNTTLVMASADATASVFCIPTSNHLRLPAPAPVMLTGLTASITCLDVAARDHLVAAGSSSGEVMLWRLVFEDSSDVNGDGASAAGAGAGAASHADPVPDNLSPSSTPPWSLVTWRHSDDGGGSPRRHVALAATTRCAGHRGAVHTAVIAGPAARATTRSFRDRSSRRSHDSDSRSSHNEPAGSVVYTGGEDGSVRAWHSGTGECLGVLVGHTGAVTQLQHFHGRVYSASYVAAPCVCACHSCARRAALTRHVWLPSSKDHTIRVWAPMLEHAVCQRGKRHGCSAMCAPLQACRHRCVGVWRGHAGSVTGMEVAPDGRVCSYGTDSQVRHACPCSCVATACWTPLLACRF